MRKDLLDPESETYFVLNEEQKKSVVFLKINWGQAQTEPVEMDKSFEIQRIYVKKEFHGAGFGKEMFLLLHSSQKRGFDWAWLGVWERNFKAQDFYYRFGFERYSEHQYHRRYRGYRLVVEKEIDIEGTRTSILEKGRL